MNLLLKVDLTGEHTSVIRYASRTVVDKDTSRNGDIHNKVKKKTDVRDSDSGGLESNAESGRPVVLVPKIADDEPPPRRHSSSCGETRIVEDRGRRQSKGSALESRRSNHASTASTTASPKSSYGDITLR